MSTEGTVAGSAIAAAGSRTSFYDRNLGFTVDTRSGISVPVYERRVMCPDTKMLIHASVIARSDASTMASPPGSRDLVPLEIEISAFPLRLTAHRKAQSVDKQPFPPTLRKMVRLAARWTSCSSLPGWGARKMIYSWCELAGIWWGTRHPWMLWSDWSGIREAGYRCDSSSNSTSPRDGSINAEFPHRRTDMQLVFRSHNDRGYSLGGICVK